MFPSQKTRVKRASWLCSTAACGSSRPCERSGPEAWARAPPAPLRWSTAGPREGAGRWRWFPPAPPAAPGRWTVLRGTWRTAAGSWRCSSTGYGWPSPQPERSPGPLWAEARGRSVWSRSCWVWAELLSPVPRQLGRWCGLWGADRSLKPPSRQGASGYGARARSSAQPLLEGSWWRSEQEKRRQGINDSIFLKGALRVQ